MAVPSQIYILQKINARNQQKFMAKLNLVPLLHQCNTQSIVAWHEHLLMPYSRYICITDRYTYKTFTCNYLALIQVPASSALYDPFWYTIVQPKSPHKQNVFERYRNGNTNNNGALGTMCRQYRVYKDYTGNCIPTLAYPTHRFTAHCCFSWNTWHTLKNGTY